MTLHIAKNTNSFKTEVFFSLLNSLLDGRFLLAFYGFLRRGEFTTVTNSFDPAMDVTLSDLTFHPDVCLSLKHSKAGDAYRIIIARLDSQFCPF